MGVGCEVATERHTLRNNWVEASEKLAMAVQAEANACSQADYAVEAQDDARAELVGAMNRLRQFRRWLVECMPALFSIWIRLRECVVRVKNVRFRHMFLVYS